MRISQRNFPKGNRSNESNQAKEDVVQSIVSLEMVFPPSFFNIMMHLLVHLVKEIGILGPVFLHNMFPFERLFAVLKKYVRNRAHPEGSITKGYITEEVIEFCVDYVEELCPIGVPVSRHEGRISSGTQWMISPFRQHVSYMCELRIYPFI